MSQRGGAVVSHLRIADQEIYSPLIARGEAHLILGLELLESWRLYPFLSPNGYLITARTQVRTPKNYPDENDIIEALSRAYRPVIVDTEAIAKKKRMSSSQNMILLGICSPILPLETGDLENSIESTFRSKGARVVQSNLAAFNRGVEEASKHDFNKETNSQFI
jgi:indolepyruvate ferredoxin oxidoreductase beta subunit